MQKSLLKEIISKQNQEKVALANLTYVERTKLAKGSEWMSSPLVKVVLGPRRAGKSVFAFLLLKGEDFAYVNFDDEALLKPDNYDAIFAALLEVYPESKYYFSHCS